MPPSSLHFATIAFTASVIWWLRPGAPAYPASSPPAILIESAVTPGVEPSSLFAPSPGPHGHGASPNIGPAGTVVSVGAVVASVGGVVSVVPPVAEVPSVDPAVVSEAEPTVEDAVVVSVAPVVVGAALVVVTAAAVVV